MRLRVSLLLPAGLVVIALTGCDPASRYGPLKVQWRAQLSGAIAAKPTVSGGKVFIGSWGGYEYAFGEASGAQAWRTLLGRTPNNCMGDVGVTSQPAVLGNVAFLGGGDSNWYALNTGTGGVLWASRVGDSTRTGGNYNWASALVYKGAVYVGIASLCDNPLNQGKLLRLNPYNGALLNQWKVVPDGGVGGGIWTTPVVDSATNTVFVTTGTRTNAAQQYAEAMVALDATTLAVKSHWALPLSDPTIDADWGTTPTLFTDAFLRRLVAGVSKNGILYAFNRNNLSAGPVWATRIANAGPCPNCGDASASTGAWDGRRLYFAGGRTTIHGKAYGGSARAIDPTSGSVIWERGLDREVLGALTVANGMVVVPVRSSLQVLDADTGEVLYGNDLGSELYAAATVANGRLFQGSINGKFRAFSFPSSPTAGAVQARRTEVTAGAAPLRRAAAPCAPSDGSLITIDCRLPVTPRCTPLGSAATVVRAMAIEALSVRDRRGGRQRPVTVRLYANGSCAGRPALKLRLGKGRASRRFKPPRNVPAGTRFSGSSTRAADLEVRIRARPVRAARSDPLPFLRRG